MEKRGHGQREDIVIEADRRREGYNAGEEEGVLIS